MPDPDVRQIPPTVAVSPPVKDPSSATKRQTKRNSRLRNTKQRANLSAAPRRVSTPSVDVDDAPSPRKLSTTASPTHRDDQASGLSSSSSSDCTADGSRGREVIGSRSKRSPVSEVSRQSATSKAGAKSANARKRGTAGSVYRVRHPDNAILNHHRRPGQHQTGRVTKRTEAVFDINPSLLSVLTSLTGISDKSSSSGTTITQRSYDRRCKENKTMSPASRTRRSVPEQRSSSPAQWPAEPLDVFKYMHPPSVEDDHDGQSVTSSSPSEYEASDAGSSEQPDTPSSRSTFPSPTATRSGSINGHVAEMRRKYDSQSAISTRSVRSGSVRSGSMSPELVFGTATQQPKVSDIAEEEKLVHPVSSTPESQYEPRTRSSSRSSSQSQQSRQSDRSKLRQHEEAMRQHMAYAQHGQYVDPAYMEYMQHYASSASPANEQAQYPYPPQMALQPYNYPMPPAQMGYPSPPHSMSGQLATPDRPPAPDAPDLTKRTLIGYEKLATELSNASSSVKPIYRKFDYLNHRMLLHIQDELSELEEQLRTTDEIIAQMEAAPSPDTPRNPSSRREEASSIVEMHHRRTALLGRIFLKTEQYNRAMASFAALNKECRPAEQSQVDAYKSWLAKHAPIHEDETKFLEKNGDLILPGLPRESFSSSPSSPPSYRPSNDIQQTTKQAALTYAPFALMLPLLLFSLIPTFGGRLIVTALIAVGGSMIVNATQMWHLMAANEWAACGGAYFLLMTAIAGCIPQHA